LYNGRVSPSGKPNNVEQPSLYGCRRALSGFKGASESSFLAAMGGVLQTFVLLLRPWKIFFNHDVERNEGRPSQPFSSSEKRSPMLVLCAKHYDFFMYLSQITATRRTRRNWHRLFIYLYNKSWKFVTAGWSWIFFFLCFVVWLANGKSKASRFMAILIEIQRATSEKQLKALELGILSKACTWTLISLSWEDVSDWTHSKTTSTHRTAEREFKFN